MDGVFLSHVPIDLPTQTSGVLGKGTGGHGRKAAPLVLLQRFDANAADTGAEVLGSTPRNDAIGIMDDTVTEGLIDEMLPVKSNRLQFLARGRRCRVVFRFCSRSLSMI